MILLKVSFIAGILIPVTYLLLYLIGGLLRENYSHIANSVSELLSPGAPNKKLLVTIQVIYAILYIIFGSGVLWYSNQIENNNTLGIIGSWSIIVLGVATIGTAVFPQDAEGTKPTKAGKTHIILVFAGLIPLSILSTLFIGLWSDKVEFISWLGNYSYITIGLTILLGVLGGLTVKTKYTGLVERIAAAVTQQWFLVLGSLLLLNV
jgi:hypothetical membrane protein